jgi:hypothetical protein
MLAFYVVIGHNFEEQFEDTKGVISSLKSMTFVTRMT